LYLGEVNGLTVNGVHFEGVERLLRLVGVVGGFAGDDAEDGEEHGEG
jgi:hypothetical protein